MLQLLPWPLAVSCSVPVDAGSPAPGQCRCGLRLSGCAASIRETCEEFGCKFKCCSARTAHQGCRESWLPPATSVLGHTTAPLILLSIFCRFCPSGSPRAPPAPAPLPTGRSPGLALGAYLCVSVCQADFFFFSWGPLLHHYLNHRCVKFHASFDLYFRPGYAVYPPLTLVPRCYCQGNPAQRLFPFPPPPCPFSVSFFSSLLSLFYFSPFYFFFFLSFNMVFLKSFLINQI